MEPPKGGRRTLRGPQHDEGRGPTLESEAIMIDEVSIDAQGTARDPRTLLGGSRRGA